MADGTAKGAEPPFKSGEIVVSDWRGGVVSEGDRVRIIACEPSSECQSGWLVSAMTLRPGRVPKNPPIALSGIDSDWFRRPGEPSKITREGAKV